MAMRAGVIYNSLGQRNNDLNQIRRKDEGVPFKALLQKLVLSVDGANGAIILDSDGETVQSWAREGADLLQLRAIYATVVFQTCRVTASSLRLGNVFYLVIEYEGARLVIEELERDCLIVLELETEANLGQALHRIQPIIASLRREIAA